MSLARQPLIVSNALSLFAWVSTGLSSIDRIEQRLRISAIIVALISGGLAIILNIKKLKRNRQRGEW
jgi:hypothetical protein